MEKFKLIKGKGEIELNSKEASKVTQVLLSCKSKFTLERVKK